MELGTESICIRCLEPYPRPELDRLHWCESCVARGRRRAALHGHVGGVVFALVLAIYVWFGIQPDLTLIPFAWLAMLVVAYYLGGRIVRELSYGSMRLKNRGATNARPPE